MRLTLRWTTRKSSHYQKWRRRVCRNAPSKASKHCKSKSLHAAGYLLLLLFFCFSMYMIASREIFFADIRKIFDFSDDLKKGMYVYVLWFEIFFTRANSNYSFHDFPLEEFLFWILKSCCDSLSMWVMLKIN